MEVSNGKKRNRVFLYKIKQFNQSYIFLIELIDYSNKFDVNEFLNEIEFNVDKFWDSISDDKWIYIDDVMLTWIGYKWNQFRDNKQKYINLLKDNFEEANDYKHINNKEFNENFYATLKSHRNLTLIPIIRLGICSFRQSVLNKV